MSFYPTGRRDPVVPTPHHYPSYQGRSSGYSRPDPVVPMPTSQPINYAENSYRDHNRNSSYHRENHYPTPSYFQHSSPYRHRPSYPYRASHHHYPSTYHYHIPYRFRPVHLVALPILFPIIFAAAIVPEFLPVAFLLTIMAAGIGTIGYLALKALRNHH